MPFVEEFVRRIFEFYDKDGDGFLNAEEFVACFVSLIDSTIYDTNDINIE